MQGSPRASESLRPFAMVKFMQGICLPFPQSEGCIWRTLQSRGAEEKKEKQKKEVG